MDTNLSLFHTNTRCPSLGCEVSAEEITTHPISGGLVAWWRCTACNRWHTTEIPELPKSQIKPDQRGVKQAQL